MKRLEELLSISLYNTCKSSLDKIAGTDADLRYKVDLEFNNFLQLLHKKIGKLENLVGSEEMIKPKIIRATTTNFIFSFTLYPNKSSEMEIVTLKRYGRQYPPDFLLSKVKPRAGYVYFLKSEYGVKIGCTAKLDTRMNVFAVKLPFPVELHSSVKCKKYNQLESTLHNLLSHKRISGEWFKLDESDFIEIDMLLSNMKLSRILNSVGV